MKLGFDLISDLNLTPDEEFSWEGKATSLYCIIAGNISSDLRTVAGALLTLTKHYQGVFYTPGFLEFTDCDDLSKRQQEIIKICKKIRNVALLYHDVVIIDGVAILGCNGWNFPDFDQTLNENINVLKFGDLVYLKNSIEKLQRHLDVVKIIVVSNSVPDNSLYFGEKKESQEEPVELTWALLADSESKISHWAYGSYEKMVETTVKGVSYICNSSFKKEPYWAKRIDIEV